MLNLARAHDFQVHLSPSQAYPAAVNPPSFNWPENGDSQQYSLELKNISTGKEWNWDQVNSPMQLSFELPVGQYQWRLASTTADQEGQSAEVNETQDTKFEQTSEWVDFEITEALANYIAPTAKELFEQCDGREQWLMYFDEDIESVKAHSADIYPKLKHTATLSVPISEIRYPSQLPTWSGRRQARSHRGFQIMD